MGMEVVYQDLALAPHLNPVQNMFLGREIPRKGILGPLGFMDEKAMRAKAKRASTNSAARSGHTRLR